MAFIKQIPYARNKNKYDLASVFIDNCGTCGTKHALLKELAIENSQPQVKLILCLFKMNKHNTPVISEILSKNNLDYILEVHSYLKIGSQVLDCTFPNSKSLLFIDDIISETEIESHQITDFKVNFHKKYLGQWLDNQSSLSIPFQELWQIREACIEKLSSQ
ncbi:MAG TPA: hypothetical protein VK498_08690 [Ferruginibacter sp.]|nr:hypothetical protein [Ferruginibacter sp.]